MAKAIHSIIRVLDETRSVDFYSKALNLGLKDRFEFDGFNLVYLKNEENDFEIELTVNHDQEGEYTHGDGYGHLAVSVDNIEAEHSRMEALGIEPTPVKEFHRNDELMAKFFFVQDPDGYKTEVLQRQGRIPEKR